MSGAYGDRSLKETPTWAVALVSAVFVIISILIEHGIHSLGKWFQKHKKKAMTEALEKIKDELMLLGFISLLITAGTNPISKICIPLKFGDIMLPCKHESKKLLYNKDGFSRRKLLWYAGNSAPAGGEGYCSKYGKIQLISQSGVHQLHIFIFLLGVFHILYSVIGMALAQAKMKKWKAWELETTSLEYEFTNGFTFGVVLLELIAGPKTVGKFGDGVDRVRWVKKTISELAQWVPTNKHHKPVSYV